jgi:hypothetical protein
MAPRLAEAWNNRAHGTSTSHNAMILAQLRITEAGIATAEAYQTKITLELANLNCEMATLRRMLEAQLSPPPAPSSKPTAEHPSVAAVTICNDRYEPEIVTVPCRGCKSPLPKECKYYDKYLCERIKDGTMKPRLTCFFCKMKYKLARDARKADAAASEAKKTVAVATKLPKKVKKSNIKSPTDKSPPSTVASFSKSPATPPTVISPTIAPSSSAAALSKSPSSSSATSLLPSSNITAQTPPPPATSPIPFSSASILVGRHGETHLSPAVVAAFNISKQPFKTNISNSTLIYPLPSDQATDTEFNPKRHIKNEEVVAISETIAGFYQLNLQYDPYGRREPCTFLRLADGRGWLHEYDSSPFLRVPSR